MKSDFLIYKKNIIGALEALSNYSFQKIAWFDNDQGLAYSYNENMLDLFYDSTLHDALKAGQKIFGYEADMALRDLETITAKIDGNDFSEGILIDTPFMQEVREKSAKALALVKASDDSESTVEIIK